MDNINDIISSLSSEDIDMLKNVASSILGDNATKDNNSDKTQSDSFSSFDFSQNEINMILKAKSIFEKMNNTSSKDAQLIIALKPHLSEESREKADKAIRILNLFEILPYIKDLF